MNGFIHAYDGNPDTPFSVWSRKFKDVLALSTAPMTKTQKLARLQFFLTGPARLVYDGINPNPTDLETALTALKNAFEDSNTIKIAKQELEMLRMSPGESVFSFTARLYNKARAAFPDKTEPQLKDKLFEEFIRRLIPELGRKVEEHRPSNYDEAYELARHFETMNKKINEAASISVKELAEKVEALVVQSNLRVCYGCRKTGHIRRDCPDSYYRNGRDLDENYGGYSRRDNGYRSSNYDSDRHGRRDYDRDRRRDHSRDYRREHSRDRERDYGRYDRGNSRDESERRRADCVGSSSSSSEARWDFDRRDYWMYERD